MPQRGLGLIPLLVGLTLIATLANLALPSFQAALHSQQRQVLANDLASGLRSARTEAILRNQIVLIHALEDDWRQGWRIILDLNGRGPEDPDNPILVERRSNGRIPVFGNQPLKRQVRFTGLGTPLYASGAFLAGTLHVCDVQRPVSHYQVVLSKTGRVSLRNDKVDQDLCAGSGERADA